MNFKLFERTLERHKARIYHINIKLNITLTAQRKKNTKDV